MFYLNEMTYLTYKDVVNKIKNSDNPETILEQFVSAKVDEAIGDKEFETEQTKNDEIDEAFEDGFNDAVDQMKSHLAILRHRRQQ